MSGEVKFRSVIKYLFLKGYKRKQIIEEMNEVYKDKAPGKTMIYKWLNLFKLGRESVFEDERSGRPVEIDEAKSNELAKIVKAERRITTRELASRLNVSQTNVVNMLKEQGIRKLSCRFVPKFLTGEMTEKRLQSCQMNLQLFQQHGQRFFDSIITQYETPLSLYVPPSKRESKECTLVGEAPKKVNTAKFYFTRHFI